MTKSSLGKLFSLWIHHLIKRGLRSLMRDWKVSTTQGWLGRPRWGPGRTLESGTFEGSGLAGLRREPRVQRARGCCRPAHLHSPDLRPWPRQTGLRLGGKEKQMQVPTVQRKRHRVTSRDLKPTGGTSYSCSGSFWFRSVCRHWERVDCRRRFCHARCLTRFLFKQKLFPELTGVHWPLGPAGPCSVPGICWGLPWWGRAAGNGLSHPRRVCPGDVGAALCR